MADGMNIQGLGVGGALPGAARPQASAVEGMPSFKDVLFEKIGEVNALQQEADKAMAALASGRAHNVNEVLAAVQKAELAFQTLMQIRDKLVEAYQEISQMRI